MTNLTYEEKLEKARQKLAKSTNAEPFQKLMLKAEVDYYSKQLKIANDALNARLKGR